jgi:rhamnose transport system substrate-binding protein
LAVALVQGKVKAIEGQSINMPNIGTRIFGINGTIITGPPVVFTKENIGNYHF